MIKVSASLLAANKEDIINQTSSLQQNNVDCVHFDVMDHIFVNNTSFMDDTFSRIREHTNLPFEVHLMVIDPVNYLDKYDYTSEDIIIVHYECFKNDEEIFDCIKKIQVKHKVGLSIKPGTNVEVLDPFLPYLDYILIMSVEPGFGGQKFMPSALDKIEYLSKKKNENTHYVIEVDGGIDDTTAPLCIEKGIDILVSGSFLFKGEMDKKVGMIKCEK